ncbi:hypothetical protein [Streptomyces formicae]|uniref:hypothetical protein n=1 Tax=Streptomyces formicae TaxID=1616117 RepID=UPI00131B3337|nr:hypothetical protein [Streptomyces formicae]
MADGAVELRVGAPTVWAAALGASFLNRVALTRPARASVGEFLTGLRVVRATDGGQGWWCSCPCTWRPTAMWSSRTRCS